MISRRALELATATLTGVFGAAVIASSIDNGIGWSTAGGDGGAFPFLTGRIGPGWRLCNLRTRRRDRPRWQSVQSRTRLAANQPACGRQFVRPAARDRAICSGGCVRCCDPADWRVCGLGLLHARNSGPAAPALLAAI